MTAITDTIAGAIRQATDDGANTTEEYAEVIAAAIEPEIRADECRRSVDPEWIKRHRGLGWPDMHPEDYCHRCGAPNPSWCADLDDWKTATAAWAAETGREGICCLNCFAEMHEQATGERVTWIPTPWRGSWELHRTDRHEKGQA